MNNWDIPFEGESNGPRQYFGEVTAEMTLKVKGGELYDPTVHDPQELRPYGEFKFTMVQVNGYDSTFYTRHFSPDWKTITKPSLQALVKAGKLNDPSEINGAFASWRWDEWRDTSDYWVNKTQQNEPEKVQVTAEGVAFVTRKAPYFLDVYDNEEDAIAAHDAHYGVQNATNGKQNGQNSDDPKMPFIIHYTREARGDTGEVDREKLAQVLANSPLGGEYDINHSVVQKAIQEVEAEDAVPF